MIRIVRTNSDDKDFRDLVNLLDAELRIIDGEEFFFYSPFNKIDGINHVALAYEDEIPLGCGAMKEHGSEAMEIKRMYVSPLRRNKGIASKILSELESWAQELDYRKCVLETGIRQPDAIHLYRKNGYWQIPNWGQYVGVESSVCFEKSIVDKSKFK